MTGDLKRMVAVWLTILLTASVVFAQVEVNSDGSTSATTTAPTPVGRRAAEKYMGVKPNDRVPAAASTLGSDTHYLAIHLGTFVDDSAYNWASSGETDDVGSLTAGVTYRMGEWVNSMDLLFRADFNSYSVGPEGRKVKMSLMPMVTFPDAASEFPLYFGAGLGLGIFFKQAEDESALSFDYQLLAGVRFFDVFENTGFFLETGMKNHIQLLSDGQFNGVFVAIGTVFTF